MNDAPSARHDDHRPFEARPAKVEHVDEHEHVRLDHERLDCYQAALELQGLLPELTARCGHSLKDQLDRASASVLLNLAEGCGRRQRRDRARFYGMARGSAMESAAIVDILTIRQLAPLVPCRQAKSLLVRVVSMLTKLQRR